MTTQASVDQLLQLIGELYVKLRLLEAEVLLREAKEKKDEI